MKRVALAVSSVATGLLVLLPGTAARANIPGGYAVTRMVLTSRTFAIAVNPSTDLAYVGEYGTAPGQGTVTVVGGAGHAVEGSITVPGTPVDLAVNPSTDTVYATTASGLTVIDGATNTVATTIASVGGDIAVDPVTNRVYVATRLAGNAPGVAVVDGATNSIIATIALPGTPGYIRIAVDPAADTVYASTADGTLSAIDGATNAVTRSVQLSPGVPAPHITSITVDSAVGSVYAVDDRSNTVDVVSAATLAAIASITGCPYHVAAAAADPTSNVVFVTSDGNGSPSPAESTCVISAKTNTVVDTFPRGGSAIAADPVTGAAYIAAWNPANYIWIATPSTTDELSPMVYGFDAFELGGLSATFAVDRASSFSLMVSAIPAATITETGALPPGVTMSSSGAFSGTPAVGTVGTYPITVSAGNGVSPDSNVSLDIVVDIAPTVTSPATVTFQTGTPASFSVRATGTPAPTVKAVDYPYWMAFTPGNSSGVLSGTPPPGSGGVDLVYTWADNGSGFIARQNLMVTVNQPPAVVADSHLNFRASRNVRYRITSTGFPAPVLRERGLLPRGLAFRAGPNGTALIVGKPATSDKGKRYLITIIASNHIGRAAAKKLTIRIV